MSAPWFVPQVEDADRPLRIIALPQAGAGCSTFADCAARLRPDTALWAANLPGRQARLAERPMTRVDDVIGALTAHVVPLLDRPYLLFGYCSGALLAFLLARAIRDAGLPSARALVVASFPAPQVAQPDRELHRLPADEFWAEVLSHGGIDASLSTQPGYREIFEPALRGDYAVLADYRYRREPPLALPVVALAGRADPVLRPADLHAWADQTTGTFSMRKLDGDHWLLDTATADLTAALNDVMAGPEVAP